MPNRFELTYALEDRLVQHQDLYARLELITPDVNQVAPSQTAPSRTRFPQPQLGQWGMALLKYFVGTKEPQISTRRDRHGNLYFVVYDPIDQQRYTFDSEQEVRGWLDRRYYQ